MRPLVIRFTLAAALGFLLLALAAPAPTLAEERTCSGTTLGAGPSTTCASGRCRCTLNGTIVKGTSRSNRMRRCAPRRPCGRNVQAEDARSVSSSGLAHRRKRPGRPGRDSQVFATAESTGISCSMRTPPQRGQSQRHWRRTLQVFQNTGGVRIFDNRIDGNLQCKENQPSARSATTTSSRATKRTSAAGSEAARM